MRKKLLAITLCVFYFLCAYAQTEEAKTSNFQLTFFTPLGTNGKYSSQYSNNYSVNLLVGVSKNENKLSMGGLGNITLNNANGIQLAGLFNYVGNAGNGIQLSGFLNRTKDYNGIQLSGFTNWSADVNGIQITGFLNKADDFNGIQIAGGFNVSENLGGFQISGLGNVANKVDGFQISGLFNKADYVDGFQVAALLNIAKHNDYPLGLVNIIRDGEYGVGVTYNEIGSTMLSFRSGGRVLYGIVGIGYNHKYPEGSFATEAGIGAHINITNKFRTNNELKAAYITRFSSRYTSHQALSILPALKIGKHLELFGGPSIAYMESDNQDARDMFPGNRIWRKFTDNKLQQVYCGFSIGSQIIF